MDEKGLEIMDSTQFPSVRDIFYKFDLANFPTKRYTELDNLFTEKLTAVVPQHSQNDELNCLATEIQIEAQAMGFEQGFAYAVKLLTDSLKTQ